MDRILFHKDNKEWYEKTLAYWRESIKLHGVTDVALAQIAWCKDMIIQEEIKIEELINHYR